MRTSNPRGSLNVSCSTSNFDRHEKEMAASEWGLAAGRTACLSRGQEIGLQLRWNCTASPVSYTNGL